MSGGNIIAKKHSSSAFPNPRNIYPPFPRPDMRKCLNNDVVNSIGVGTTRQMEGRQAKSVLRPLALDTRNRLDGVKEILTLG